MSQVVKQDDVVLPAVVGGKRVSGDVVRRPSFVVRRPSFVVRRSAFVGYASRQTGPRRLSSAGRSDAQQMKPGSAKEIAAFPKDTLPLERSQTTWKGLTQKLRLILFRGVLKSLR